MARYVINMNYVATYTAVVEGDFKDEGEALDAARRKAEDADINEFSLNREMESQIIEEETKSLHIVCLHIFVQ